VLNDGEIITIVQRLGEALEQCGRFGNRRREGFSMADGGRFEALTARRPSARASPASDVQANQGCRLSSLA